MNFDRYGIGVKISIKSIVFILDIFQEKLTRKLTKDPNILFLGYFEHFLLKLGQKWVFLGKRAL